jgi:hypothetical protein
VTVPTNKVLLRRARSTRNEYPACFPVPAWASPPPMGDGWPALDAGVQGCPPRQGPPSGGEVGQPRLTRTSSGVVDGDWDDRAGSADLEDFIEMEED